MRRIVRPRFYRDVAEEVEYLAETAGPEVALRWAEAVWTSVSELQRFPGLGRERRDLPFPSIRSWRVNDFSRWLILYEVREKEVVFYRVRHGAMDLFKLRLRG